MLFELTHSSNSKINLTFQGSLRAFIFSLQTNKSRQFQYQMMSSPSRYKASSPVRALQQRFYSRPLETILEENNVALRLSNSLIFQNQYLQKQNQRLVSQHARSKEGLTYQYAQNITLKKEREDLDYRFRSIEAHSEAQRLLNQRELESQQRQNRLIRQQYGRENQTLKEQIGSLTSKISLIQLSKRQQLDNIKKKCLSTTVEQTEFVRRNLSEELKKVIEQLQVTRQLLIEKQRENIHLVTLSQQNADKYSASLQNLISQNNILRNQLLALEIDKNKEIQQAENKKQLQKSRTKGILSYVKESSHFMEKQLTRLAQQLLQKNISIESFTKQLLKQKRQSQANERRYEELISKVKIQSQQQLKQKDLKMEKQQKNHKQDITSLKSSQMQLQEQLSSKLNELDNINRELCYCKQQLSINDRQILQLKDSLNRMYEDHSKELSKVMLDSKVKRRSGLNISSYSSSSLKDLDEAQGSSIIKAHALDKRSSLNQGVGSGRLPVVKQQLAMSQGHIDDEEQEDIQMKELILHYESMIQELKKNKINQIELANQKIESLKSLIQEKQQEIVDILNRFSPLVQLKANRPSIEQERRVIIEQSQKADVAILQVLLEKYQIVSLRSKKK